MTGGGRRQRPGDGQLSVVALDGVPEVHVGDDLAALLIAALRTTPGALAAHARPTCWS